MHLGRSDLRRRQRARLRLAEDRPQGSIRKLTLRATDNQASALARKSSASLGAEMKKNLLTHNGLQEQVGWPDQRAKEIKKSLKCQPLAPRIQKTRFPWVGIAVPVLGARS